METSKISPNVMNLAMPRGRLSFAPVNDSGVMTGEIDLGNVTALDLTNAMEYKEHYTSHDDVVTLDAKKIATAKWTLKFSPDELSAENMALFFLGDPDKQKGASPDQVAQTGNTVADQDGTVYLDRWVDLGKKYIKADSITLSDETQQSAFPLSEATLGVDYRIDNESGLVMILSTNTLGTGVVDATPCKWTFKYGSCALRKFVNRIRPMQGFLRYRGTSEVGPRHEVQVWKVQIVPDAALGLVKPQDYANLSFSGDVFIDDDTGTHKATDPFFKVVELSEASSYPS